MAFSINTPNGKRTERKHLITVATWTVGSAVKAAILGVRVEDSSIEFNADVEQKTDILGINYAEVLKTQPQQSFDPADIVGGDDLMAYLNEAALSNSIASYNGTFNIYVIAAYMQDGDNKYYAVKHSNCSIIPQSIGGSSHVGMPFDVYFSNEITEGSVSSVKRADLLKVEDASSPTFTAKSAT